MDSMPDNLEAPPREDEDKDGYEDDNEESAMIGMFGDPEDLLENEKETVLKWDTYERKFSKSDAAETLRLCLIEKHHSLWGEFIYNAARVISDLIDGGRIDVEGKSAIELGAGAGLPSVICALNGSSSVAITDYGRDGDRGLIEAIDRNIEDLQRQKGDALPCIANKQLTGHPYVWGDDCQTLLRANGGERYDVVIMADCIFNRSVHKQLVESMIMLMSEEGLCYCSFSHHDPQKTEKDLVFLELCRERDYRTDLIHKEQRQSYPFLENDGLDESRGWVYCYEIRKRGGSLVESV